MKLKTDPSKLPLSATIIISMLLLALFWWRSIAYPLAIETAKPLGFALGGLADRYLLSNIYLASGATLLLILLNAITITRIVTGHTVLGARTYMPMIIYIIAGFGMCFDHNSLNGLIAAWLIILASDYLIRGYRRKESFNLMFRGGLVLGFAPLFFPPSTLFFLLLIGALILFKRSGQEGVVGIAGYLLPTLTGMYIYWAQGFEFTRLPMQIYNHSMESSQPYLSMFLEDIPRLVVAGLLAVLALLSIVTFISRHKLMRKRAATIYPYFLIMLCITAGCFLLPSASPQLFPLAGVSLAVITPLFMLRNNNVFSLVLYILLLLSPFLPICLGQNGFLI